MNKMLKKILSGIITASMLMSSVVTVLADDTDAANPWAVEKGEGTFRFGIMSDTHIAPGGANDTMKLGLDAFNAMGVDGLALAGDISISEVPHTSTTVEDNLHTSVKEALDTYKYEIKADDDNLNNSEKLPLVYAMGNHELATNHQNATGIWYAKELFAKEYNLANLASANVVDEKYTGDYVAEMGGYKFIVASPNNGLEIDAFNSAAYAGAGVDTESWVKSQIEAANQAYIDAGTPNKPIFYMQHIPVNGHYGRNFKANSDEFMTFLKNYPNVIVLSAHTHNLIHDPRLISQDEGYTSIITGVMSGGSGNVLNGNITGIGTGGDNGIKHQLAIDVTYDGKSSNIKVYRMDVENQEFIGDPYEFTLNGEAQTKYSTQRRYEDEGRSKAAWNEGATLTATAVEGTRNVTATYPTDAASATVTSGANADVLQDDFLWGYKIFAVNKATGVADKTSTQAFEFFRTPTVNERTVSFENLERNQEYEIKAYPITIFQYADTYQELDVAGVEPLTLTVKTYNVKSDAEKAQQMTRTVDVSYKKETTYDIAGTTYTTTNVTDENGATWLSESCGDFIVDLERSYKLTTIKISTLNNNASGRDNIKIWGSNDKTNWAPIYSRGIEDDAYSSKNKTENSLTVNSNGKYYRYVKVQHGTGDKAYLLQSDIVIKAEVPVTNVAYGKSVDASDTILHWATNFPLNRAVDGDNNTEICSNYDTDYYHYLQLDLGKKYPIGLVEFHKRVGNTDTNAKSYWNAYGSNSVSDRATLQTLNALDTSIYTKMTTKTDAYFDHDIDVITEKLVKEDEYQYITIRKERTSALLMGEIRAFVVNPTVADFAYTDGTATLTFTDAMNFANVNNDIKVYDSTGAQKSVTFTPNADNTAVTFAAEAGDKVVVSQNITNTFGIDMQEDKTYDIYDLSIDYSGKTKKKFKNVNVAYGKDVITDYVPDQTPPAGVDDYYLASQLTNGVQYGFVSATKKDFVIDLGRGYNLNKIVLKMPATNDNDNAVIHFTLSGSADGKTWTPIHVAPTDKAKIDTNIWNGKVGTFNIDEDVNYRYIKYSHPFYFVLDEIEAYADVEATKVSKNAAGNPVTSSTKADGIYDGLIIDGNYDTFSYVNGSGYNWLSVQLDQAYPIGMYELYLRGQGNDNTHQMDNWKNAHDIKLYGSNAPVGEALTDEVNNLDVADLSPYGFDTLATIREAYPFMDFIEGNGYNDKGATVPDEYIYSNGLQETINNTTKYKNLTLKHYTNVATTLEFSEFAAYVLNSTINVVDADNNGVDIHFGDKMVEDLLNEDTITLTNIDGEAVDFTGSLSENDLVYTLDATLADGFYTLTVADDVKNVLGVPMQADFTYDFAVGDVYGIKTADGGDVTAIAANTTYVVTEPVSGNNARIAIAAIYDANDMLVASSIENISADYAKKYAEVEITTPETLAEGAYYVKYFLWEANTLMPVLSESIKVFE